MYRYDIKNESMIGCYQADMIAVAKKIDSISISTDCVYVTTALQFHSYYIYNIDTLTERLWFFCFFCYPARMSDY